jgi:purine nucleosidase
VTVEEATWNAGRLCALLEWDVPVFPGAALPLVEDPAWFADWQAGYGPTPVWLDPAQDFPAADAIVDLVRRHPGQVTLIALGPLTNFALALSKAPEIAGLVREVICMGGSFSSESSAPEFNFRSDPEAAHITLRAKWPIRLFGLDQTRKLFFSREAFDALPAGQPAVDLLRMQAPGWIDRVEEQGWEEGGCSLHDAAPIAALIDPSLFEYTETNVFVVLAWIATRGQARFRPGNGVRAATAVQEAACRAMVQGLLCGSQD